MLKGLVSICIFLLLCSCSSTTVYQARVNNQNDGYREIQLSATEFQIYYTGDELTPVKQLADFALLRAAQLAQHNNFAYLLVSSSETVILDKAIAYINNSILDLYSSRSVLDDFPLRQSQKTHRLVQSNVCEITDINGRITIMSKSTPLIQMEPSMSSYEHQKMFQDHTTNGTTYRSNYRRSYKINSVNKKVLNNRTKEQTGYYTVKIPQVMTLVKFVDNNDGTQNFIYDAQKIINDMKIKYQIDI